jgi:putative glutamine amidotransferase
VPTYHHQAVRPASLEGSRYRLSAWHADGTLEGMEDPSSGFRLAVQWHPEAGEDGRLFEALVAAAAARRAGAATRQPSTARPAPPGGADAG